MVHCDTPPIDGNRNQIIDVFGKITNITQYGSGNPTVITAPLGNTMKLSWDSTNDTLTNITDPKNNTYIFNYDTAGNLCRQ